MTVDPKWPFWIGLVGCVALILSATAIWAGAVPDAIATELASWMNIIAKCCLAVMTYLTGVSSSATGPIAKWAGKG